MWPSRKCRRKSTVPPTFLPTGLPNPPIYSKVNPADAPILTLAITSSTLPLVKVEDLADTTLAQKNFATLRRGAGEHQWRAASRGGACKPTRRHSLRTVLSLEDLRTALANANIDQAKGTFDGQHQAFTIGANDQLLSSEGYNSIIVAFSQRRASFA